ncbi:MAG: PleD family two-component system response regulator [Cyanobacteriota bacterium]|nr:PleD family two-component system response regulator [Cyanobacteriota bacterium]
MADFKQDLHRPAQILVVDDDPVTRMQLRLYLQKEGHQITLAQQGQEALALFPSLRPDLVLLDAMMPVMNGFDCCRALGELEPDCPVLMITGLEDEASVDRAFEAGAMDYVTKPIHWAVLRQRVKRLVYQNRLQLQLEAANQLLQGLALVDELTQLANRRQLDNVLATEWQAAQRGNYPVALILIDVDYFKKYNDHYGHPAGDVCLREIARVIAQSVSRPKDLAARYGGEEFMVVLPDTPLSGAQWVGETIRRGMRELNLPHEFSLAADHVTLSMGCISAVPSADFSLSEAIALTDHCLYQAKSEGRDRLITYPPCSPLSPLDASGPPN